MSKHDHRGYMTARDALEYAAGSDHWHCTVISKRVLKHSARQIWMRCVCGTKYAVAYTNALDTALRNVPEEVRP